VVRACIYAVDKNELAVDLCKVALWMEGHCAGYPLGFLDHHVKHGDSLVGIMDLKVLEQGIPDEAYNPVTGDDKAAAAFVKKRNTAETQPSRQLILGTEDAAVGSSDRLADGFQELASLDERTPGDVHAKEQLYGELRAAKAYDRVKTACDLWTAAFFLPIESTNAFNFEGVPTTQTVREYLTRGAIDGRLSGKALSFSHQHPFFHWPLEFPDVFRNGGFDVVLGNPPWERIKLQEKEFFAARDAEIAGASSKAVRERLIGTLRQRHPALAAEYEKSNRRAESESKFARTSGRFPLTGRGDINTYSVFVETGRKLLHNRGRLGMVVPTGIAADDTTKDFFGDLVKKASLSSLFDFENRKGIFKGVQGNMRFCLLTIGATPQESIMVASQLDDPYLMHDASRICRFTVRQIAQINPNTLTLPLVRTTNDARIIIQIYEYLPVLIRDADEKQGNPWRLHLTTMYHMSNDSGCFRTQEELSSEGWDLRGNTYSLAGRQKYLPLVEAKLVAQFNHRNNSFAGIPVSDRFKIHAGTNAVTEEQLDDPHFRVVPRFWVSEAEFKERVVGTKGWFLGFRNAISAVADSRSLVASIIPSGPVGNSLPLIFSDDQEPHLLSSLCGTLNSFVLDYVLRQKAGGGNLNFFILKQLPVPLPLSYSRPCPWSARMTISSWVSDRVLELAFTSWDLQSLGQDLGYTGHPFRWKSDRRFLVRCELDACFFHIFGVQREDVDYIMDTFRIVKRRDEEEHGEYRTKRLILEIYDDMNRAIGTGQPYQTRLNPPPGDPRAAHPE
jgi:hypothetical protein